MTTNVSLGCHDPEPELPAFTSQTMPSAEVAPEPRASDWVSKAGEPLSLAEVIQVWSQAAVGHWQVHDAVDLRGERHALILRATRSAVDWSALPEREITLLDDICAGKPQYVIAARMGMAPSTVSGVLQKVKTRLGFPSFDALLRAFRGSARALTESDLPAGLRIRVAGEAPETLIASFSLGCLSRLSAAERAVARLAASGCSNADIARRRSTSPNTVAKQMASVMLKLELARTRIGLAIVPELNL